MTTTINADSSNGFKVTADTSSILALQTNGTTAISIDASQAVSFTNSANLPNTFGFKNRIINGAMVIDQRNAGASVNNTAASMYTIDRYLNYGSVAAKYSIQQNAGSVTPPAGFKNYYGLTSLSAFTPSTSQLNYFSQYIEGYNTADLSWGTASASSITISFWVRSSLTGVFSGCVTNAVDRSYPFTYTVSVANTWEYKTVVVAGDTSGTWGSTNSTGIVIRFNLGSGSDWLGTAGAWAAGNLIGASTGATSLVGTNGATLYFTGLQLEKGSTATSFDYRPYGTELALCQRYYSKLSSLSGNYVGFGAGVVSSTTSAQVYVKYPVRMRSAPTLGQSNTAAYDSSVQPVTSLGSIYYGDESLFANINVASGLTVGRGCIWSGNNSATAYIDLSAEL